MADRRRLRGLPALLRDANGDGVGDLPGITARLDYLAWLGVDAIWISPFYPSPMADFGYDVADYCAVHPLFGTLADFDRLVEAAHARGLRVILDFVPNHTSVEHPWFVESRSRASSAKRDWYTVARPAPDGGRRTTGSAMFNGPAWDWDRRPAQYYYHAFLPEQPDLNWRNPECARRCSTSLRFWLARGVDGFRIDVCAEVIRTRSCATTRRTPRTRSASASARGAGSSTSTTTRTRACTSVIGAFRRCSTTYGERTGRERMSVGELHHPDFDVWAGYYGARQDEIHVPFNFHLLTRRGRPTACVARSRALRGGAAPRRVAATGCSATTTSRASPPGSGAAQARAAACCCC